MFPNKAMGQSELRQLELLGSAHNINQVAHQSMGQVRKAVC